MVEKFNDVNFRIVCCATGKSQVGHYNRIRSYRARVGTDHSIPQESPKSDQRDQKDKSFEVFLFTQFLLGLGRSADDDRTNKALFNQLQFTMLKPRLLITLKWSSALIYHPTRPDSKHVQFVSKYFCE